MNGNKSGIALLLLGIAAYLYSRETDAATNQYATYDPSAGFLPEDFAQDDFVVYTASDDSENDLTAPLKTPLAVDWRKNEYPKYAAFLRDTEDRNGIPRDLLARQLAKETGNYQLSIINGDKTSPVGAMGIAQFMPGTASDYGLLPGKGPGTRTDPIASIAAAGKYMKALYRMFNSWRYALAAYNWGPGNVKKWLAGTATPPQETQDYLASITADVPVA